MDHTLTVCCVTPIKVHMTTLLRDVEAYLAEQGLSPTAFGDEALNDRHFVRQLRGGRRVWPETEQKVRSFMASRSRQPAEARA